MESGRIAAARTLPSAWLELRAVPGAGLGVFVRQDAPRHDPAPGGLAPGELAPGEFAPGSVPGLPAGLVLGQYTGRATGSAPATLTSRYLLAVAPSARRRRARPWYFIDADPAGPPAATAFDLPRGVPGLAPDDARRSIGVDEQRPGWTLFLNSAGGTALGGQPANAEFITADALGATAWRLPEQSGGETGTRFVSFQPAPGRVYVVTERPVAPGEQLLVEYGAQYWTVDEATAVIRDGDVLRPGELRAAMISVLRLGDAVWQLLPPPYESFVSSPGYVIRFLLDAPSNDALDVIGFLVALPPAAPGQAAEHAIVRVELAPDLVNGRRLRELLLHDAAQSVRGQPGARLVVDAAHADDVFGAGQLGYALDTLEWEMMHIVAPPPQGPRRVVQYEVRPLAWRPPAGADDEAWAAAAMQDANATAARVFAGLRPAPNTSIAWESEWGVLRRAAVLVLQLGQVQLLHAPRARNERRRALLYAEALAWYEAQHQERAVAAPVRGSLRQALLAAGYRRCRRTVAVLQEYDLYRRA